MAKEEVQTEEKELKKTSPESVIKNHVLGSMGIGLLPIPLLDMAALTGVQVNMLRKLAKIYDVPFSKDKGKHVLASLLGGGVPVVSAGAVGSFIKTIPVVGQTVGMLTMPVIAGATTYAVGKVFLQHFASGGTFLNFRPEEVKTYYEKMFKEGEKVAAGMKSNAGAAKTQSSAA